MAFGKNNNNGSSSRKKPTKGFSELNRRTYEARTHNNIPNQNNGQNGPNVSSNAARPSSSQPTFVPQSFVPAQGSNNGVNAQPAYNDPNMNPDGYRRGDINGRYRQQLNQAKAKKKKKIIIIAIVCCVIAMLIGAGIAVANIMGNMNEGMDDIGLTPTQYADAPFYMVLMGVDSSDERKGESATDNDFRSDSIILTRIDPVEKIVSMVSLHRDCEVDMGEYGTQKLNAAHSLGGPELVIKTVSKLAGVPINHYAEINFDGFVSAVNNLGGVEVNVPMEIDDYLAGGHVYAGNQVLSGEDALVLCRSRHAYDDYGDGDRYRAANQRLVLSAIAKKALSADILTIAQTVTELSKYIKTDFSLSDIIGLAQIMKDMDPSTQVYSAMMPTTPEYKDGVWYENLDQEEWDEMMKRMDQGLPPSKKTVIDPETGAVLSYAGDSSAQNSSGEVKLSGTVAVRNGTTKEGLAATVSTKIESLGFTTDVANANTQDYTTTVIVYTDDSQAATAQAIKDAIGCGEIVKNNNEYAYVTDYLVVVGTDYTNN